ncbi:ABC transporter ATP-binding protein [Vibrio parahaemolyticus]|uniref:ABC transporter ATP-binding protein n=1 Tax=Vibrio parahaemolyticus TaxID=670 RepID=UPI00227111FF|nr:ABC transporter ATP-binding protein [Vibrio parahaemolyticus]ELB2257593.1 ABC transporter ATP-binding protein [Vibrio parahaemolyticus]MBE3679386.1 ABC transporter ATP-binding protein [Vibrio parahaemolyticus]MDN4705185.1 ABC transporter ATP-binding protein [Vibrio parahaemolyticus]MDN4713131.1 ABC transporter ATP-binding protein [Vibrio parahaemolyticus]MDN4717062.1 ABC transporter ATP-binding protein [Vibrio parahaemolyticus]
MTDSASNVVELKQAQFVWPGSETAVINIPDLQIATGEHVFIKGPSGCGKSTLLALLTGINTLSAGSLSVLNTNLATLSSSRRDRFRADHIGYIFQQFNLLPYLNVIDNVLLPCQFSKVRRDRVTPNASKAELLSQATTLLERLHLPTNLHSRPVSELSIGQQQRVAAARALIGHPALVIADEPTSALDHDNRMAFIELLMEQANQANATLIFVSHDPTLESLFDRTINLPEINQGSNMEVLA